MFNHLGDEHLFNGQGGGLSRCWRQNASALGPRRTFETRANTVRKAGLF
jgi:hypothetical protein